MTTPTTIDEPREGPTSGEVSSDLPGLAAPDDAYKAGPAVAHNGLGPPGSLSVPNDGGRHWHPGSGELGPKLDIEQAEQAGEVIAHAITDESLGPAARRKACLAVNAELAVIGMRVVDANAPAGPDAHERAVIGAKALAATVAGSDSPNAEHTRETFHAAARPLGRRELRRERIPSDEPRPERPPRP